MTSIQQALVDDLEHVIADRSIGDRAAMLRRVTDLFVVASGKLSDEQVALFDDVMGRLLEELDTSATAAFGQLLATVPGAPPRVVRRLALDDAIDVARPILVHSGQVDERTLVEGAKTKSQAHLLAISQRKTLVESVTDVLVERGDRQVVLSTVGNSGAAFSEFGYSKLVHRASTDNQLAACIWSRPEISRQNLLKMFADASEAVRLELTSADPRKANVILEVVTQASHQIQARTRESSDGYAVALAQVKSLQESGGVSEAHVAEFARAGKFDEAAIALSFICDLPVALVERAFVDVRSEQLIVIARAFELSWETVKAILRLQAEAKSNDRFQMEKIFEAFMRLRVETARKAIQFYRLRARAAASKLH